MAGSINRATVDNLQRRKASAAVTERKGCNDRQEARINLLEQQADDEKDVIGTDSDVVDT
jgi:hypothetical protein